MLAKPVGKSKPEVLQPLSLASTFNNAGWLQSGGLLVRRPARAHVPSGLGTYACSVGGVSVERVPRAWLFDRFGASRFKLWPNRS